MGKATVTFRTVLSKMISKAHVLSMLHIAESSHFVQLSECFICIYLYFGLLPIDCCSGASCHILQTCMSVILFVKRVMPSGTLVCQRGMRRQSSSKDVIADNPPIVNNLSSFFHRLVLPSA